MLENNLNNQEEKEKSGMVQEKENLDKEVIKKQMESGISPKENHRLKASVLNAADKYIQAHPKLKEEEKISLSKLLELGSGIDLKSAKDNFKKPDLLYKEVIDKISKDDFLTLLDLAKQGTDKISNPPAEQKLDQEINQIIKENQTVWDKVAKYNDWINLNVGKWHFKAMQAFVVIPGIPKLVRDPLIKYGELTACMNSGYNFYKNPPVIINPERSWNPIKNMKASLRFLREECQLTKADIGKIYEFASTGTVLEEKKDDKKKPEKGVVDKKID